MLPMLLLICRWAFGASCWLGLQLHLSVYQQIEPCKDPERQTSNSKPLNTNLLHTYIHIFGYIKITSMLPVVCCCVLN